MLFVVLLATGYLGDFIYCYLLYSVCCWDLGRKGDTPAVEGLRLGISGARMGFENTSGTRAGGQAGGHG